VDQERNCYACGVSGTWPIIARRERAMEGRRVEYEGGKIEKINEHLNNLKGVKNLELLN